MINWNDKDYRSVILKKVRKMSYLNDLTPKF